MMTIVEAVEGLVEAVAEDVAVTDPEEVHIFFSPQYCFLT
jgi:hypothetical protein